MMGISGDLVKLGRIMADEDGEYGGVRRTHHADSK
jgi:hypothetical protein